MGGDRLLAISGQHMAYGLSLMAVIGWGYSGQLSRGIIAWNLPFCAH